MSLFGHHNYARMHLFYLRVNELANFSLSGEQPGNFSYHKAKYVLVYLS